MGLSATMTAHSRPGRARARRKARQCTHGGVQAPRCREVRATLSLKICRVFLRLKELLRTKLIECGWRDELKEYCKGGPISRAACAAAAAAHPPRLSLTTSSSLVSRA